MTQDEADGEDWRSVSTRTPDEATIEIAQAQARARKPGHGRSASQPSEIPSTGWRDILERVFWAVPRDRVLSTAGGVAFFALLSIFQGIATIVSLYSLFVDPALEHNSRRVVAAGRCIETNSALKRAVHTDLRYHSK